MVALLAALSFNLIDLIAFNLCNQGEKKKKQLIIYSVPAVTL